MPSIARVMTAMGMSAEARAAKFVGHALYVADFQTIKSRVAHELCHGSIYRDHRAPILLLRNIDGDYRQMSRRIIKVSNALNEKFGYDYVLPLPKRIVDASHDEIATLLRQMRSQLLIGLCNAHTVRKLIAVIEANPDLKQRFNLIIDEGDLFTFDMWTSAKRREDYMRQRTLVEQALATLYTFAHSMHTITGTPFPLYCSQTLTSVQALQVVPFPGTEYHGFEDVTYVPVATQRGRGRGYHWITDEAALKIVFADLLGDRKSSAPAIMLVNPGPLKADHAQVVNYVCQRQRNQGITVLVHNDVDIKVYLPPTHPYWRSAGESKFFPDVHTATMRGRPIPYRMPSFWVRATGRDAKGIAEVLQMLKNEHDAKAFRHNRIVIVAGAKAGRGLSFVSDDYGWHLSHMYLVAPPTKHCEGLLQAASRICGMYRGKPVLKLFLEPAVWAEIQNVRQLMLSMLALFSEHDKPNLESLRNFFDPKMIGRSPEDRWRVLAPGRFSFKGYAPRDMVAKRKNPEHVEAVSFGRAGRDTNYFDLHFIDTPNDGWTIASDAVLMDSYIALGDKLTVAEKQLLIDNLPNAMNGRTGNWQALDEKLKALIAVDLTRLRKQYPKLRIPDVLEWRLKTGKERRSGYKIHWDRHVPRKTGGNKIIRHEWHLSKVRNMGSRTEGFRRLEYFESHAFVTVSRDQQDFGLVYLLYNWDDMQRQAKRFLVKFTTDTQRRNGERRTNETTRLRGPFMSHFGGGRLALHVETGTYRNQIRTQMQVLPDTVMA